MAEVRAVYVSNLGVPATGLTLTWLYLKKQSDGTNFSSQPVFTEIGGGWYKFTSDVTIDEKLAGVIDCSSTVTVASERYIPVLLGDNDMTKYSEVICTPVYNESSDTIQFFVMLLRNGVLAPTAELVSAEVKLYDDGHNLLFTVTGSSNTNGVFVIAKNNPSLSTGEGYYMQAKITVGGSVSFTSVETMFTLD